jgi:site-specific DNA-cytosine methylase
MFVDIMKIKKAELPDFNILEAASPCQDFSTMGLAKGPTVWQTLDIVPNDHQDHGMEATDNRSDGGSHEDEVIGFLTWNAIGEHLARGQAGGSSFHSLSDPVRQDWILYMYYITIQLSQLNVPQYRDRLWCFPVRKDVADAIGGPSLREPTAATSPRIGDFLRTNTTYYKV